MARRRSLRAFGPEPNSLEHVGQLAWSAQGVTDAATGYRTAPSAGGTLAVEVDLLLHGVPDLEDGVYRYHPVEHALRRRLAGGGVAGGTRAARAGPTGAPRSSAGRSVARAAPGGFVRLLGREEWNGLEGAHRAGGADRGRDHHRRGVVG